MKKATALEKNLKEDLEFARRTEEAWKKYEKGEFTSSKRANKKQYALND